MKSVQQFKGEVVWLAFYIDFVSCFATGLQDGYIKKIQRNILLLLKKKKELNKRGKKNATFFGITSSRKNTNIGLRWKCY